MEDKNARKENTHTRSYFLTNQPISNAQDEINISYVLSIRQFNIDDCSKK